MNPPRLEGGRLVCGCGAALAVYTDGKFHCAGLQSLTSWVRVEHIWLRLYGTGRLDAWRRQPPPVWRLLRTIEAYDFVKARPRS